MISAISLHNGAKVLAADVSLTEDSAYSGIAGWGSVVAVTENGEYVSWLVYSYDNLPHWYAYSGNYFTSYQSALTDYNARRGAYSSPDASLSSGDLDTIANALSLHADNLRVALCKETAKHDTTYTTKAQDLATQFSAVIKTYRRFVDYKNSLTSHD